MTSLESELFNQNRPLKCENIKAMRCRHLMNIGNSDTIGKFVYVCVCVCVGVLVCSLLFEFLNAA